MFSTKFIIFTVCCIALGHARTVDDGPNSMEENDLPFQMHLLPYRPMEEVIDDQDDHESMPPSRVRRQIFGGFTPGNPGVTGTLGARGNLLNNNGHMLQASGQVSKTFTPMGPTNVGGGLNYQGPHAGAGVHADHTHRQGTNLGARANYNLWRSPNGMTTVGAEGRYDRHFGGPTGNSRPSYGAVATFNHRF